jgi:hypothetical protein
MSMVQYVQIPHSSFANIIDKLMALLTYLFYLLYLIFFEKSLIMWFIKL